MRLSILLWAMVSFASIYVACNKHTVQKPLGKENKILSGWSRSINPQFRTTITFNEARNVIKEEDTNEISLYEFTRDSVLIREFNKDENRFVYEFSGKLDSNRRLTDGIATSSYITSTPDTVKHSFRYNKHGYLLTETRVSSVTDTFLIQYQYEDNTVRRILTYSNGELYNSKEFTYYPGHFGCSLPEEYKFRRNIHNLVGHSNPKAIEKIISTAGNGKQKYTLHYTFEMDESGNAFKMTAWKGKKVNEVVTFMYAPAPFASNTSVASVK